LAIKTIHKQDCLSVEDRPPCLTTANVQYQLEIFLLLWSWPSDDLHIRTWPEDFELLCLGPWIPKLSRPRISKVRALQTDRHTDGYRKHYHAAFVGD